MFSGRIKWHLLYTLINGLLYGTWRVWMQFKRTFAYILEVVSVTPPCVYTCIQYESPPNHARITSTDIPILLLVAFLLKWTTPTRKQLNRIIFLLNSIKLNSYNPVLPFYRQTGFNLSLQLQFLYILLFCVNIF